MWVLLLMVIPVFWRCNNITAPETALQGDSIYPESDTLWWGHPAFRDVKNVQVNLKMTYPDNTSLDSLWVRDRFLRRWLSAAGVNGENQFQEASPPDAILSINMIEKGTNAVHWQKEVKGSPIVWGTQYTILSMKGTVEMETPSGFKISRNIQLEVDQAYCPEPGDQDYDLLFFRENSFGDAIVATLVESFGIRMLIQAFRTSVAVDESGSRALLQYGSRFVDDLMAICNDRSVEYRWAAAYYLGRIGDQRAVPALILLLNNRTKLSAYPQGVPVFDSADDYAEDALKKITGQDFGKDALRWEEWWRERMKMR